MQRFYTAGIQIGQPFELSDEESRHAIKVLRHKVGDQLACVNGMGSLYLARILSADPRKTMVQAEKVELEEAAPSPAFTIAVAPTKNTARVEWMLEKMTEIGISRILFMSTRYAERSKIKTERWERILISAMKQSGQLWKPSMEGIFDFQEVLDQCKDQEQRYIAYCEQRPPEHLFDVASSSKDSVVLIGPEGDFSKEEISAAQDQGFKMIGLGESRLRTETAAMVALHSLHLVNLGR